MDSRSMWKMQPPHKLFSPAMSFMNRTCVLLAWLVFVSLQYLQAKENTISSVEAQDGWILLFDGESFFGLSQEGGAAWSIAGGTLIAGGTDNSYLRTNSPFVDFVLKAEVRLPSTSSEGAIFVRTTNDGIPVDVGYRIELGDSDANWPPGSIARRFKSHAAPHIVPNQWHTIEVEAKGEELAVSIDGKRVAEGKDASARAGYIGFSVPKGSRAEFRNLKLKPINPVALFNGKDLTGWKAVSPEQSKKSGGMLNKLGKIFGGGKGKDAEWSVENGMIHGKQGPGQLETTAMYDDFVLQVEARLAPGKKKQDKATLYMRGAPGQLFSGYELGIDPTAGVIRGLASPRKPISTQGSVVQTIVARGRHFQIWVNGYPVTEFNDTRPEGASIKKDAKTTAGVISLPVLGESTYVDFRQMKLAVVPKTLGGTIGKPAPATPSPAPAVAAAPSPSAPAATAPAPTAMPPTGPNPQDEIRAKTASLMSQALKSSDPEEQMQLYDQIVRIDPANGAAAQGYKEAQQKLANQRAEAQKQQSEREKQEQAAGQKEALRDDSMQKAESAFLAGDLPAAQNYLSIAERVAPSNPAVQNLRRRIDAATSARSRITYLATSGGVLALAAIISFLVLNARKKHGYIEIISGIDKGKRFDLDKDVIRIGAVPQDGGTKNDIVVRDVERMISRFHCEVQSQDGKFYLVDRNSSNGTRLDKKPVVPGKPVRMKKGARIELAGTATLRFGLQRKKKS